MIDDDSRHAAIKNNYGGNAGFFKAAIDIYMHGLIAKTQETQTAQMTCYAGTAGGVIYDEGTVSSCENLAPIGNLRDFDWNFQKLWLVAGDEGTAQEGRGRLLLHARIELLLPVAAVQSEALDSDQETGTGDEEGAEGNRSSAGTSRWSCGPSLKTDRYSLF